MLVSAILDGQLPAGEPIPSGRKLAEELGVACNTLMLAYQQLADEGYLVSRERSGFYVNPEILGARASPTIRRVSPQAPTPIDARELASAAANRGVLIEPGDVAIASKSTCRAPISRSTAS